MEYSGAEVDVLICLFCNGPTFDGDIPSKAGRGDLFEKGLADRYDGHTYLTRKGVQECINLGYIQLKDKRQKEVSKALHRYRTN